jgi:hypothetical protein
LLAKTLEKTDANGYKELVLKFKKVFPVLKEKKSSNFSYGASHYLKALKLALVGAWLGRSLSQSKRITRAMDLAFQNLEAFVELLDKRAADRVRAKLRNRERNATY